MSLLINEKGTGNVHIDVKSGRVREAIFTMGKQYVLHILTACLQPLVSSMQSACKCKGKSSPITGLECPTGFQKVKAPRFRDNGTGWW